jgi:hypothetical protein
LQYVEKALDIKDKPLDYLCEDFAWGSLPYDLASISCYNLKNIKLAISYGEKALELEPTNERLKNNLIHYTKDNI